MAIRKITSRSIGVDVITAEDLAENSITVSEIQNGAVTSAKLATDISITNLAYTGTLTGGTGVVNLGSGQFYKDASGNIGVGTTSPSLNASQTSVTINGTNNSRLDMYVGGTNTAGFVVSSTASYLETRTAFPLIFNTNNTERMRITSTGVMYLGALGTNLSFTNGTAVNISGSGTGIAGNGTNLTLGVWSGPMVFQAGNSGSALVERMRIDSSGNVGIGTSSPTKRLQVTSVANTNAEIRIQANASNDYSSIVLFGDNVDDSGAIEYSNYDNHMQFDTNSTERMRIDGSGDIFAGGSTINGATGSIYSKTTAKAFVQWVGSSGTINQSKNVSSVTRNGTGNYTVNFAFTFTTNYSIVLGGCRNNGRTDAFGLQYYGQTGSTVNIDTYIPTSTYTDAYTADLVVFA
jgi:hypothetical protein